MINRYSILLIENDISVTADIVSALGQHLDVYNLSIVKRLAEAVSDTQTADVILLDIEQLAPDISENLAVLQTGYPDADIFLLVPSSDTVDDEQIIHALSAGASNYFSLSKPDMFVLGRTLAKLQAEQAQQSQSTKSTKPAHTLLDLLAENLTGDTSKLAIQIIGDDNRIKIWNRAAETLFGIKKELAIDRLVDELPLRPGNLGRLKDIVDQARTTGQPFTIPHYTLGHRHPKESRLLAHAYPIVYSSVADIIAPQATNVCIITAQIPSTDRNKGEWAYKQDLQILLEANREISGQLALKPTLQKVIEQTKFLLNGDNCQIYFIEKDNKTLRAVLAVGPLANEISATVFSIEEKFIRDIITTGYAVTINAAAASTAIPYPNDEQLLGAPLTAAKGTIGLVVVSRRKNRFRQEELDFFESLVQQASSAINNARLFEETQRSLVELEILYSASMAMSTHWDDQSVLNTLIHQVVKAMKVSLGFITRLSTGQNKGVVQAVFANNPNVPVIPLNMTLDLSERAIMLKMLNQPRPLFLHLSTPFLDNAERTEMEKFGAQSRLVVPLIAKGETIGWLELWETHQERIFTADEIRLSKTLSSQIAIALQNSVYMQQTQQSLEEASALYRIANALSTLQDPQVIMSTVLGEYLQALGLNQGSVVLFDFGTKQGIVKVHCRDETPTKSTPDTEPLDNKDKKTSSYHVSEGQEIPLSSNPVYERIMRTHQAVIIDDPQAKWLTLPPRFSLQTPFPPAGGWGSNNAFAILVIPIKIRSETMGVLIVENTRNNRPFDDWVISLGQAMADQLGVGLQNVRLYEAEYQRREQAETLREVSSIVSSSLNLSEVLEDILDQLNRVVKYDSAAIHLIEGKKRRVIAARGFNQIEKHIGLLYPIKLDYSEPGSIVIHNRQPAVHNNISTHFSTFKRDIHKHIKSWMGIPLIARDKVTGLISIDHSEADAYQEEDVQLAMAFANQVAIALENARLYEIEVRELERELEIAQQIQETLLPQTNPQIPGLDVAGRIVPARQVGGDFFHFFSTGSEQLGVAIGDVSGKGIPAALYMAAGITAIDTQVGPDILPGEMLNRLNKTLYTRLHENKMNIALQIASFQLFSKVENYDKPSASNSKASLMTVASAGMIAPIGATKYGCRLLPVGALPIGAVPAPPQFYTDDVFFIEPKTSIIFTSDGIVEAQNQEGELFGFERLEDTILKIVHTNNAEVIADYIINAVNIFAGNVEQHDDMTVVVVSKT